MSVTGLPTFDETIQLSNQWLNELMPAVDWDYKHRAYRLFRATLHTLRDRLPAHEAVQLGAQLPMLIRGLYYEGWRLKDAPPSERTKAAFLSHIEAVFKQDPNADTESLVKLLVRRLRLRRRSLYAQAVLGVRSAPEPAGNAVRDHWNGCRPGGPAARGKSLLSFEQPREFACEMA